MNAVMRTIDLTTKIIAPVVIGSLISYWSKISGAVFILVWNIVSGIVEIYLILKIYKKVPQLKFKTVPEEDKNCRGNVLKECWGSWRSYFEHPIKWAGVGFSCLYMSVLGFDQITIGENIIFVQCLGIPILSNSNTFLRLHVQPRRRRKFGCYYNSFWGYHWNNWKRILSLFTSAFWSKANFRYRIFCQLSMSVSLCNFHILARLIICSRSYTKHIQ